MHEIEVPATRARNLTWAAIINGSAIHGLYRSTDLVSDVTSQVLGLGRVRILRDAFLVHEAARAEDKKDPVILRCPPQALCNIEVCWAKLPPCWKLSSTPQMVALAQRYLSDVSVRHYRTLGHVAWIESQKAVMQDHTLLRLTLGEHENVSLALILGRKDRITGANRQRTIP